MSEKSEKHVVILPVQFSIKVTMDVEGDKIVGTSAEFNRFLPNDDDDGDVQPWQACMEEPPTLPNKNSIEGWPDYTEKARQQLCAQLGRVVMWDGEGEEEGDEDGNEVHHS
jgi:hypothetical protein